MKKILPILLFALLTAIPACATDSNNTEPLYINGGETAEVQFHDVSSHNQEAFVIISDNGTIWIDPSLSREDIVKMMFEAGWPDDYEFIYGGGK